LTSPPRLHGAIEVEESQPQRAWLDRTAVVGYGILDLAAAAMTYEMGVLRWPDDIGPSA